MSICLSVYFTVFATITGEFSKMNIKAKTLLPQVTFVDSLLGKNNTTIRLKLFFIK